MEGSSPLGRFYQIWKITEAARIVGRIYAVRTASGQQKAKQAEIDRLLAELKRLAPDDPDVT